LPGLVFVARPASRSTSQSACHNVPGLVIILFMRSILINLLLLFSALTTGSLSLAKLKPLSSSELDAQDQAQSREALYLPSGPGLELMSFGYQKALSHLFWFKSISYFAKHYRGDRNYVWLSHMCELVTRLDPAADYAYHFCGMMLAWEGNMPQQAIKILSTGIENFPSDWVLPYLRGSSLHSS